jgi:anaerobic selenocysteine-containing dehydrogenase
LAKWPSDPAQRIDSPTPLSAKNAILLRELRNLGTPLSIHPADAAGRKIETGALVKVFNVRGACLARAVLTESVRESVVTLPTGAWFSPAVMASTHRGIPMC